MADVIQHQHYAVFFVCWCVIKTNPPKDFCLSLFYCWLQSSSKWRRAKLCLCLGGRQLPVLAGMLSSQPVRSCSRPLLFTGAAQKLYMASLFCCCAHFWVMHRLLSFTIRFQSSGHWSLVDGLDQSDVQIPVEGSSSRLSTLCYLGNKSHGQQRRIFFLLLIRKQRLWKSFKCPVSSDKKSIFRDAKIHTMMSPNCTIFSNSESLPAE